MGLSKTEIFTEEQNRIANMAKAIAHPARVAILQHLLKVNTCICGSLVEEIGLSQATISQHLKEMKQRGLLQGRVVGTSVCYCIHPEVYADFHLIFSSLFGKDLNVGASCC